MNKNVFKRGFTLIELLVVIAIIGILASVVLASLNSARDKGADAAIKSSINNMRAQAELFYDGVPGNYGVEADACTGVVGSLFVDPTIAKGIEAAENASGGNAICGSSDNTTTTGADATSWVIAAPLKTDPAVYYCVDSRGVAATSSSFTPDESAASPAQCP